MDGALMPQTVRHEWQEDDGQGTGNANDEPPQSEMDVHNGSSRQETSEAQKDESNPSFGSFPK